MRLGDLILIALGIAAVSALAAFVARAEVPCPGLPLQYGLVCEAPAPIEIDPPGSSADCSIPAELPCPIGGT